MGHGAGVKGEIGLFRLGVVKYPGTGWDDRSKALDARYLGFDMDSPRGGVLRGPGQESRGEEEVLR